MCVQYIEKGQQLCPRSVVYVSVTPTTVTAVIHTNSTHHALALVPDEAPCCIYSSTSLNASVNCLNEVVLCSSLCVRT